jgi:hypothetical protein
MNDPVDPDRMSAEAEPDGNLNAALRAAFGPASTVAPHERCGVLEAIRQSTGVTSQVLLRDEPDAPSPVVGPAEDALLSCGPGRYQLLGEVARGGMGIVLKGRDPDLGRDVAMKVLHPGHAGNPALVRRFIEEAQIGGQLQHPGILPVYELGFDADLRPYFTMRLVKGRSLAALLEERPDSAHDLGRFLAVFEQMCQTAAYAHARGVIHRDLKPSNIMVGAFGEVQVVDWGLSKVLQQGGERQYGQGQPAGADEPYVTTVRTSGGMASQSGSVLGTPSYMSPEQARGQVDELDEQVDVFALGAILCEILTGQPPYNGSRAQILEDAAVGRLDDAFARLDSCGAEADLLRLAKRCLDPSRAVRLRHAGVLAREVTAFLTSVGDRARSAEVVAAEARATAVAERKARRRTSVLAAAVGIAIMAGGTFAIVAERGRRARAEQSVAEVAALFRKADWFRDQARRIPPDQLGPWEGALAQVRRTAEIVGVGAIDEDTRKTVVRLLDELRNEEQSVRERDRQFRASLRGRLLLAPAPGSPLPASGGAVAAGDVNGDRCADLVLCTGTTMYVFFGSARSPWRTDPDVTKELPAKCSEIAVADVNHDGKQDVVLADHDRYTVDLFLGRGDGRFQVSPGSPFIARVGKRPHTHGLKVADVNGDGHPDIVTANNNDGDVSLLLGDGQGRFARAPQSPFPCGRSPYPMAATDINGDGCADILVPNSAPDVKTLNILLGNRQGELVPAPGSPLTCDASIWYVAAGDLNGDRRPDIVATHNEGGSGLTIMMSDDHGKLSPAPGSPLELGHGAWGVEVADMDGDGNADLVVAGDEAIRLLVGDGRGGFQPAAGSPYRTGKGAWGLVVADFNGDGNLDVATNCVEANRVEILFGN